MRGEEEGEDGCDDGGDDEGYDADDCYGDCVGVEGVGDCLVLKRKSVRVAADSV